MQHLSKIISNLIIAFTLIIGVSCNAEDQHSHYEGFYKYKDSWSGDDRILKITKDKDSFLLHEDDKVIPLEKTKDGFKAQDQLVKLSSDKQTLYLFSQELPRVTKAFAENLIKKQEDDKKLCKKLDKEAAKMAKEIKDKDRWNSYVDSLKDLTPKGCILINNGRRWF